MASMLGLGALTNVATLDELVNGRGKAGDGVASLDEVTRFRGAPVSGQHTRLVVADDFLDTGRGDNHMVNTPNAAVFEVGLGKERTIRGEELSAGDGVCFVVVEPGVLGAVRDQGTEESIGFRRARERVSSCVRDAGDVTELDVEGLDVSEPTCHPRGEVGRCFPMTKRDVISECNDAGSSP